MPDFNEMQRERLAQKKQAMPDGSYPIRNVSDLKNAIQSYGRAKDKDAVKRWIKKRARELDAENLLPESWSDDVVHYDFRRSCNWGVSLNPPQTSEDSLSHYGRLGMKWGKHIFGDRRGSGSSGSSRTSSSKESKTESSSGKASSRKITKESVQRSLKNGVDFVKNNPKTVAKVAGSVALSAAGLGYLRYALNLMGNDSPSNSVGDMAGNAAKDASFKVWDRSQSAKYDYENQSDLQKWLSEDPDRFQSKVDMINQWGWALNPNLKLELNEILEEQ